MIQQLINEALLKEQQKRRPSSGKISPSQMGYCYRRQYWYRKGEPASNPFDARTLRIFKVGDIFEEFVSKYLPEDMGRQVLVETEDIKGYADFVTKDEVIDIKSQHSRGFWWMNKDNYNINEEKKPNILQVMTYAYLLDKPKGRLVYVSKDDLCILEYGFHINKWVKEIENELSTLKDFWSKGVLPPAQPRCYWNKKEKKFKECEWCLYQDKCKEVENEKNKDSNSNMEK
ncbi:MAG: hypothetical protein ACTSUF_10215 [Candidatus Heimdallarchaeaceae archaeon]